MFILNKKEFLKTKSNQKFFFESRTTEKSFSARELKRMVFNQSVGQHTKPVDDCVILHISLYLKDAKFPEFKGMYEGLSDSGVFLRGDWVIKISAIIPLEQGTAKRVDVFQLFGELLTQNKSKWQSILSETPSNGPMNFHPESAIIDARVMEIDVNNIFDLSKLPQVGDGSILERPTHIKTRNNSFS